MYVSECTLGLLTVTEAKPDAYQAEEGQSSVFYVSLTFTIGENSDPSVMNPHTYMVGIRSFWTECMKSPPLCKISLIKDGFTTCDSPRFFSKIESHLLWSIFHINKD